MLSASISSTRSKIEIAFLSSPSWSRISAPSSIARGTRSAGSSVRNSCRSATLTTRAQSSSRLVVACAGARARRRCADRSRRSAARAPAPPASGSRSFSSKIWARCRPMSTARAGSSASGIWRSRMRTSASQSSSAVVDARQRLQRLDVGGQQIEQLSPRRGARVRRSRSGPSTSRASWRRYSACCAGSATTRSTCMSRIARQVVGPAQRRVDLDQRVQRLAVVGIEAHDLLPALRAAPGRVLQRAAQDARRCGAGSAASRRGWRRAWCADRARAPARAGCRRARGSARGASACRGRPAPPAGSRSPPTGPARRSPVRSSQITSTRRSSPTRSCFVVGARRSARAAACARLDEVALALVGLDDGAHRHRVLSDRRAGSPCRSRSRAPAFAQLLAVDLRDPPQDLGALTRVGLRGRLALEQRGQAVPALALEQQAPLRLARARVRGRDLLGALPGRDRALGVAQVLLADRRRSPPAAAAARRRRCPPAARARTRTRAGRPAPPSRPSRGSARRRRASASWFSGSISSTACR